MGKSFIFFFLIMLDHDENLIVINRQKSSINHEVKNMSATEEKVEEVFERKTHYREIVINRTIPKTNIKEVDVEVEVLGPLQTKIEYNYVPIDVEKDVLVPQDVDHFIKSDNIINERVIDPEYVEYVNCLISEPKMETVDVFVPKILNSSHYKKEKIIDYQETPYQYTNNEYNAVLLSINDHLTDEQKKKLPFK